MTSAALLLILGAAVSLLAAWRSRRVPALRPVAVACGVFVALDAARWVGAGGWLDVAVFVCLPGVWAGLLVGGKRKR